ncbi:hypothetical protein COO60DRAFT_1483714 [Scenedesmus sp. NREL 46B-D3]|nr:hypothetical protein COO60DRAFT_1483714 [Scenedesmus sp. NREL 46B-D3]
MPARSVAVSFSLFACWVYLLLPWLRWAVAVGVKLVRLVLACLRMSKLCKCCSSAYVQCSRCPAHYQSICIAFGNVRAATQLAGVSSYTLHRLFLGQRGVAGCVLAWAQLSMADRIRLGRGSWRRW